SNPENVRLTVIMKLQEALDEEAILEEQMLALMHRFADRFTDRRVEINNLMVQKVEKSLHYQTRDADHCSKRKSSLEPTTTVLLAKNTRYY
ncbi:hypothetical protein Tco_0789234, partial [Tanacetum coccineum]